MIILGLEGAMATPRAITELKLYISKNSIGIICLVLMDNVLNFNFILNYAYVIYRILNYD